MQVTALTTFLHNAEGMWRQGQVRDINDFRATELLQAGLVARISESDDAPAADETEESDQIPEQTLETGDVKEDPEPAKRTRKPRNPVTETK